VERRRHGIGDDAGDRRLIEERPHAQRIVHRPRHQRQTVCDASRNRTEIDR